MIRVQFNGSPARKEAEFRMVNESTVELTGDKIKPETTGFKTYRLNGEFLGDYSEYTEITAEVKNGYHFSKPE